MQADVDAQLRAWVEYFRDLGVHDFYRSGDAIPVVASASELEPEGPALNVPAETVRVRTAEPEVAIAGPGIAPGELPRTSARAASEPVDESRATRLVSFDKLAPIPATGIPAAERAAALQAVRSEIGDCTRCPLAYAGRQKIVFGDGSPTARLMFVGEGPGADEDAQGLPFVGKAGQLLNNMIGAMGLTREEVYIANVVKCRPPNNRVPEPVEANTCSQFLLRQIDIVQPQVIVALGSTAATYLLGVKQSLSGLRGRWHSCRGAKLAVTYHPAFLLRDPRQKAEAWKDLQMVMAEMGLKPPVRK